MCGRFFLYCNQKEREQMTAEEQKKMEALEAENTLLKERLLAA